MLDTQLAAHVHGQMLKKTAESCWLLCVNIQEEN
jgi:hypothetical protein